ncbi:MAG: hypothetical protein IJ389_01960 [Clostridia bacterium]|nr:hypothetical protein [Clostridia bacterium]
MAISPMKKLYTVVPKKGSGRLLKALQCAGCVEVISSPFSEHTSVPSALTEKIHKTHFEMEQTERAVQFLMEYNDDTELGFGSSRLSVDDLEAGLDIVASEKVAAVNELQNTLYRLEKENSDLEVEINTLSPFIDTRFPIPAFNTAATSSVCGSFPSNTDYNLLLKELSKLACTVSLIYEDKYSKTVLVTSYKDDTEKVIGLIHSNGFTKTHAKASENEGFARGKIQYLNERLAQNKREIAALKKEASQKSRELLQLKALYGVYASRLERLEARKLASTTESTVVLCGWVPEANTEKICLILDGLECAYSLEDPSEQDNVPVLLINGRLPSVFEPVMTMYSVPLYGTYDPTVIMSFFYILIFGLMFADVGYGALLFFGSLLILKKAKLGYSTKKMLRMFMYCSLSCILCGALFGGYFGDIHNAVATGFLGIETAISPALWFDMINDPIRFFTLSLGIGVLHLVAAMLIKFYILCRDGEVFSAFADVGSWLLLFTGIGVCFINLNTGLIISVSGALALILTQGRHEKNLLLRLAKGVMSLYSIVSYASDLLSYSRILALSLSSAIIAGVVNTLATMSGFSLLGIVLFIIVFTVGHALNIAVNLLGTYVHTSRLQYLEFFGKFFVGGGREFAPFKYSSKYVVLK